MPDSRTRQFSLFVLSCVPISAVIWTYLIFNITRNWIANTWWAFQGEIPLTSASYFLSIVLVGVVALFSYRSLPNDPAKDVLSYFLWHGIINCAIVSALSFFSIVSLAMTTIRHKSPHIVADLSLITSAFVVGGICWGISRFLIKKNCEN